MSKVLKSVGKVFKAVIKVAKVAVPIALAAAAVVFTAGSAIPAVGALVGTGGLSGAVAGALGTIGITSPTIIGAVTYAGFGAAAGGLVSAVSGKNVIKGMQTGAVVGGVTGGIAGATMGAAAPGLGGISQAGAGAAAPGAITVSELPAAAGSAGGGALSTPLGTSASTAAWNLPSNGLVAPAAVHAAAPAAVNAAGAAAPGFWSSPAGGMTIAGIGNGLSNMAMAGSQTSAAAAERAATAANYKGLGPGLMTGTNTDRRVSSANFIDPTMPTKVGGAQNIVEKPSDTMPGGSGLNYRYVVDEQSGSILRVPVQ